MRTIQIHFDDTLDDQRREQLRSELMALPHVSNVEVEASKEHDMLIEFEERHNMPMSIMDVLHNQGLHPDITAC
ncbi:hypothetical protein [Thiohalophilus thiocyanatoxydans]|uniref:HMA domain-containing protein n=1 Tax=Thiohalophilus thiocyanatoxydans TaxID=381308 RepID=A0A4R8ITE6_9GAMM|nr:hypothetical protein [Thiohalophilus thiocyanatoxydans]TDY00947.1 hypothetical protein EDC23_1692 [Thiohalophilus thiocyanatoxydans]